MHRPSSSFTTSAVVIGLDSITGLQTARALSQRGIPVAGVAAKPAHPAVRTNACERREIAPPGGQGLVDRLLEMAASFADPPVLFPCTDLSVLALATHRDALTRSYRMVLPEAGIIELLLDKALFQAYAQDAGLPIARTRALSSRAEAVAAAAELTFPCVLKPAVKTPRWQANTNAKVYRVDTPHALLERYDTCARWTDRLVAQEWIEGTDEAHVTCNAYFDAHSRPHLTYVSQKIRQWPLEGGVGCFSRSCLNDEVREATIRVFAGLSHRGLAYLEMKREPKSGRYLIIEPNVGRPTGRSAAADANGIELLLSHYCDALGLPLPAARAQSATPQTWIYFRQDMQSAIRQMRDGRLSPAGWVGSLQGCRRDAVFSWSDPRPFIADLRAGWSKATKPAATSAPDEARSDVDFDIHGVIGVRLLDASARDVATVARQLGPFRRGLTRPPDLTIRFVDHLPVGELRWIEVGRTGFSNDAFYVLQSGKRPAAVKLPLEHLGKGLEIVCQRGARSIPFLISIVTLLAVEHGCVPLHASAFSYNGQGALVTGWAKGGKTEALLAFTRHGAEYIGDEWILLTPDGRMAGLPEHIRLQDWHLAQLPALRARVPLTRRLFFSGVRHLEGIHRRVVASPLAASWPGGVVNDALPALKRQLNTQFDPADVFARQGAFTAPLQTVFFMASHNQPVTTMIPADASQIAARMQASVEFEQLPLMSAWIAHRFAFPDRANDFFDGLQHAQRDGLARLLAGTPAFEVRHPYPCQLETLFEAMAPAFAIPQERVDFQTAAQPAAQGAL